MEAEGAGAGPLGALALGLILGSFANVCAHRLPEGRSVVKPRSRCPACGALIRWYDNIPVLSFLLLRARCRACGASISWSYPLVEAAMGAGFLGAYMKFGATLDGVAAAALFFACLVLTVIDTRHFILPDVITLPGAAAGLAVSAARAALLEAEGTAGEGNWSWLGSALDQPARPLASLTGAAVGAAVPLLARAAYRLVRRLRGSGSRRIEEVAPEARTAPEDDVAAAAVEEGMGLGDVKMLAMVGAFLGARLTLVTILAGSIGGCLLVVPWLALTRRGLKTPVPFGPFIAGGAVLALFAGEDLAAWYAGIFEAWIG